MLQALSRFSPWRATFDGSRGLNAQVVHNCSGSKHISESLSRFGVGPGAAHLIVAKFDMTDNDAKALAAHVSPLPPLPLLQHMVFDAAHPPHRLTNKGQDRMLPMIRVRGWRT
jgi:hypothetical protein